MELQQRAVEYNALFQKYDHMRYVQKPTCRTPNSTLSQGSLLDTRVEACSVVSVSHPLADTELVPSLIGCLKSSNDALS